MKMREIWLEEMNVPVKGTKFTFTKQMEDALADMGTDIVVMQNERSYRFVTELQAIAEFLRNNGLKDWLVQVTQAFNPYPNARVVFSDLSRTAEPECEIR